MEALFFLFSRDSETKSGRADSFADKLSSKYTVSLLSIFALLASTRLFIYEPISCFCPAEFPSSQISFVEKLCWTQDTYFIPMNQSVNGSKNRTKISYYQWVSLILALQAFLFYLPSPMWKILSKKSGLALSSITDASSLCRKCPDVEESESIIHYTANTVSNYLSSINKKTAKSGFVSRLIWTPSGNYLSFLYIFIKCVYMINAVCQLYILDAFLGQDYSLYGLKVLRNIAKGEKWFDSKRFPRWTMCKVSVRDVGNIRSFNLQCALPMNLMYEMMFLTIWFWLIFVMVVTAYSLLKWFLNVSYRGLQRKYVLEMICQSGQLEPTYENSEKYNESVAQIKQFVNNYLKRDGCFILLMVDENAGSWVAANVTSEVWKRYKNRLSARAAHKKYLETVKNLRDEGIEVDKSSSIQNTSIDQEDYDDDDSVDIK